MSDAEHDVIAEFRARGWTDQMLLDNARGVVALILERLKRAA